MRIQITTSLVLLAFLGSTLDAMARDAGNWVPVQRRGTNADGSTWAEGERRTSDGGYIRIRQTYRPQTPESKAKSEKWHKEVEERRERERRNRPGGSSSSSSSSSDRWERDEEADKRVKESEQRHEALRKHQAALFQREQEGLAAVTRARKAGQIGQAVVQLEQLSSEGSPRAAYLLATMYEKGDGVKVDKKKALTWFYNAARNGSGEGAYSLALAYLEGDGVAQDDKQAIEWLTASSSGQAKHLLGSMYLDGEHVKKDFKKAWDCFKQGAQQENTMAKACLGEMSLIGLGMRKSTVEARKWLEEAAGRENAKGLFYLAKMYATGDGVEQNQTRANELLTRYNTAKGKIPKRTTPELQLAYKDFDNLEGRFERLKTEATPTPTVNETPLPGQQIATPVETRRAPVRQAEPVQATPAAQMKTREEVYKEIEELVKQFYPKAKIVQTEKTMHFEFKARATEAHGRLMQLPNNGGIVGDIQLSPGKYRGSELLNAETNEPLCVSLLMAPYSSEGNNHLLTSLKFPPDTPHDFVANFKEVVSLYSK